MRIVLEIWGRLNDKHTSKIRTQINMHIGCWIGDPHWCFAVVPSIKTYGRDINHVSNTGLAVTLQDGQLKSGTLAEQIN